VIHGALYRNILCGINTPNADVTHIRGKALPDYSYNEGLHS